MKSTKRWGRRPENKRGTGTLPDSEGELLEVEKVAALIAQLPHTVYDSRERKAHDVCEEKRLGIADGNS